jgi:hypothetical protein
VEPNRATVSLCKQTQLRRIEQQNRMPEIAVECRANAEYKAYRARGVMRYGRRFGAPPKPFEPLPVPARTINVTNPDSPMLKPPRGFVQS